jgi:hypothetical protein
LTPRRLYAMVAASLLIEVWLAYAFLGWFMIATLGIISVLFSICAMARARGWVLSEVRVTEQTALKVMVGGIVVSLAIFFGFKNRPGAYQGSPAAYMDPFQSDAIYDTSSVQLQATRSVALDPAVASAVHEALTNYGNVLKALVHAYWIMDRNYNYSFHNELFWRRTAIVPQFRQKALDEIEGARQLARATDESLAQWRSSVPAEAAAGPLLDEIKRFVDYNLRRAKTLEEMSAGFEQTKAGLQHATHLYEGEGKMLDDLFLRIVSKHKESLNGSALVAAADQVHQTYGNRIIGF